VRENQASRTVAVQMMADAHSSWEAQQQAYQIMTDKELLLWDEVKLSTPPPRVLKKHSVICDKCGDKVHEHCEVVVNHQTLCKPCADGAYFSLVEEVKSARCSLPHQMSV